MKNNPLKWLFSHIRLTPSSTFRLIHVTGCLRLCGVWTNTDIKETDKQTDRQIDMDWQLAVLITTVRPPFMQQVHEPPYVEESNCRFIASLLSDTDKQDITECHLEKKTFLSTLLFLNETGTQGPIHTERKWKRNQWRSMKKITNVKENFHLSEALLNSSSWLVSLWFDFFGRSTGVGCGWQKW